MTSSTTSTVVIPEIGSGGVDVNATLPIATAAVAVTETTSIAAPNGVTAFSSARAVAAKRGASALTDTPVDYLEFSATANVATTVPSFTFTLPSITSGAAYYIAAYGDGGWTTLEGPGTVSGLTVSFPSDAVPVAITPTAPIYFVLYAETGTAPTSTPTASPSLSPSPTPTAVPTPVVSPNSLVFDAANPSATTVAVSEAGYTGSFTASAISCTASPTPEPSFSPDPNATPSSNPDAFVATITSSSTSTTGFTVQGGDEIGTCTFTITDSANASALVSIAVDESNIGISAKHRK